MLLTLAVRKANLGLGLYEGIRIMVRLIAGLLGATACVLSSSAGAQITIQDGAARVRYGDLSDAAYLTAGVPQTVLSKGLIPHLAGSQFSYRVAGDTREFSVVTDSPDQPTITPPGPTNTALIEYASTESALRNLFNVDIQDTVVESGATITYTRVATFENVSGVSQTLTVMGYADDVLNSGFNNVSATLLVPSNSIQLTKASSTLNFTGVGATAFEVTAFPDLIDSLEDAGITSFLDGGLPFLPTTAPPTNPGDWTGGFEWPAQVVAIGGTASYTMIFQLTAAPFGPGSDGSHIVNTAGTIVNAYAPLDSDLTAGTDRLFVPDVSALTLPVAACTGCERTLSNGDLLMIYQPQGASIDTTNTLNYGNVTDLGGAGRYEFVYVANVIDFAVGPDEIEFFPFDGTSSPGPGNGFSNPVCTGLRYDYTTTANAPAMVVRVPQYSFLRVEPGASVVAQDWNWDGSSAASLGGVLAVDVGGQTQSTGIIELGGAMSADGAGFRGGNDQTTGATSFTADFVSGSNAHGEKGESVVGTFAAYDALGGRFARGAPANGGGGANGVNSSGGGGANAGDPAAWTNGHGVLDPAFALNAWLLDPETRVGPGPFTVAPDNSGGGRGGYTWSNANQDALVVPPGDPSWVGDNRRVVGGLGGRPLSGVVAGDAYRRVYFGGGGGAGEVNNLNPRRGGDGGGFVFVLARRIEAFGPVNPRISANGANGQGSTAAPLDGNGGGGGGGSVVVTTSENHPLPATLEIQANGGAGGSHGVVNPNGEGEGGGGGGGAGVVLVSHSSAIESVAGGLRGVTLSTSLTEFPANGGTSGAAGEEGAAPDRDGPASPLVCLTGPDFTTPVTNAYFEAERLDRSKMRVRFDSASEVAHAGFFVLGSRRERLSGFIAASGRSGAEAKAYEVVIDDLGITELYLADIDVRGKETIRGPFEVGKRFGAAPTVVRYNWSEAQQQLSSYRAATRGMASGIAKIGVRERGMVRVTHEQLIAAGIDLSGTPGSQIAVRTDTGPVPRRVRGAALFGVGSSIEFFGDAKATLWSQDRFYLIEADASSAVEMGLVTRAVSSGSTSNYTAELTYAPQNAYNEVSPIGDPWYADRLVSQGGLASKTISLSGPASIGNAELDVLVWGGIDWPSRGDDHSIRVRLNGQLVASERFDGLASKRIRVPVTLSGTNHQIVIEAPGDTGQPADIIHIESATLRYTAAASGNGSTFFGQALQGTRSDTIFQDRTGDGMDAPIAGVITVNNVSGADLRAYRIVGGSATEYQVSGSPVAVYAEGFSDAAELWVGPAAQLRAPQSISVAPAATSLFGASADWLAITHGMFSNALNDLASRRQSQGLSTKIVNVEAIYTRYSAGNPSPVAIQRYIKDARAQLGTDYVVLVGADTTDAPGYENSGSISFVPTPYATTSIFVRYAPADPLMGDINGDGMAEVAVGRLPVRTLAEVQEAVRKILAYENQPAANQMTLAAGPEDTSAVYQNTFAESSEALAAGLPNAWTISRVYQDVLGLNPARQALVDAFNAGRSVVSYVGHSGPSQWTFDPMFDISQVQGTSSDPNRPNLASSVNQPIVLQFACWTTYFVSPTANTMAQALMLTPNRGASAIVGATVLLDQASHDAMMVAVSDRLVAGARIGDVVNAAKAELKARPGGAGPEILLGQVILGDPAQPIR